MLVPWHLQPRYVSGSAGAEAAKKKKMNRKQRTRRRKEQQDKEEGEEGEREEREGKRKEGEREEGEDGEEEGTTKLHNSSEMEDKRLGHVTMKKDHVMPDLGHVTTKGDHMTPSLEAQGFKTFLRYYHVFQRNELSALFNEVGGVRILEEFYDHENWCVVAEKTT